MLFKNDASIYYTYIIILGFCALFRITQLFFCESFQEHYKKINRIDKRHFLHERRGEIQFLNKFTSYDDVPLEIYTNYKAN